MLNILSIVNAGCRGLSLFLGIITLALTLAVVLTGKTFDGVTGWAINIFGMSFLFLLSLLFLFVCFSWVHMIDARYRPADRAVWTEAAEHAANGTATLALTYTLLGISLGISSLADQELNTDTIQTVIGGLTGHFSQAFMTTVVGLPMSAVLRALIAITEARLRADVSIQTAKTVV